MTTLSHAVTNGLKKLHTEEEGMEALQTVLVMALATVVLGFAYKMMSGNGSGQGSGGGIFGTIGGLVGGALDKFGGAIGRLIPF